MIFQFTVDKVLSGEKVATSRLWKDDYTFSWDEYDRELPDVILSLKAWDAGKIRRLYQVGQVLSVQPARGQKGVGKIRILSLQKRDVRNYSEADIAAEGFPNYNAFMNLWTSMHNPYLHARVTSVFSLDANRWRDALRDKDARDFTALFITFELVKPD